MTDPLRHAIQEGMALIVYWVKEWKSNGDPVYDCKIKVTAKANASFQSGSGGDFLYVRQFIYPIGDPFLEAYGVAVADEEEAKKMCDDFILGIKTLPEVPAELLNIINQELV